MKFGIVNETGEILKKTKYPTASLRTTNNFVDSFIEKIQIQLSENPTINKVGIAIPGHIAYDRKSVIGSANIPEFVGIPLIETLETKVAALEG